MSENDSVLSIKDVAETIEVGKGGRKRKEGGGFLPSLPWKKGAYVSVKKKGGKSYPPSQPPEKRAPSTAPFPLPLITLGRGKSGLSRMYKAKKEKQIL